MVVTTAVVAALDDCHPHAWAPSDGGDDPEEDDTSSSSSSSRRSHSHSALDAVPTFAPATLRSLTSLDLSHNHLLKLNGLQALPALTALDLSSNFLEHEQTFGEELAACGALTTLSLAHNWLRRLDGVESLEHLVHLDVRSNRIARALDIRALSLCSDVRTLRLGGNPLLTRARRVMGRPGEAARFRRHKAAPSRRATRSLLLNLVPQLECLDDEELRGAPKTAAYGAATALAAAVDATDRLLAQGARVDPCSVFAASTRIAAAAADACKAIADPSAADATAVEARTRGDATVERASGRRAFDRHALLRDQQQQHASKNSPARQLTPASANHPAAALGAGAGASSSMRAHGGSYHDLFRKSMRLPGERGVVGRGTMRDAVAATPAKSLAQLALSDCSDGEGTAPPSRASPPPQPTRASPPPQISIAAAVSARHRASDEENDAMLLSPNSRARRRASLERELGTRASPEMQRRRAAPPKISVRLLSSQRTQQHNAKAAPKKRSAFGRTVKRASPDLRYRPEGRDPFKHRVPGSAASPPSRHTQRKRLQKSRRRHTTRGPSFSPPKSRRNSALMAEAKHAAAAVAELAAQAQRRPGSVSRSRARRIGGSALRAPTYAPSRRATPKETRRMGGRRHVVNQETSRGYVVPVRAAGMPPPPPPPPPPPRPAFGSGGGGGGGVSSRGRSRSRRGGGRGGGRGGRRKTTKKKTTTKKKKLPSSAPRTAKERHVAAMIGQLLEQKKGWLESMGQPQPEFDLGNALEVIDTPAEEIASFRGAAHAQRQRSPPPPPPLLPTAPPASAPSTTVTNVNVEGQERAVDVEAEAADFIAGMDEMAEAGEGEEASAMAITFL